MKDLVDDNLDNSDEYKSLCTYRFIFLIYTGLAFFSFLILSSEHKWKSQAWGLLLEVYGVSVLFLNSGISKHQTYFDEINRKQLLSSKNKLDWIIMCLADQIGLHVGYILIVCGFILQLIS